MANSGLLGRFEFIIVEMGIKWDPKDVGRANEMVNGEIPVERSKDSVRWIDGPCFQACSLRLDTHQPDPLSNGTIFCE